VSDNVKFSKLEKTFVKKEKYVIFDVHQPNITTNKESFFDRIYKESIIF